MKASRLWSLWQEILLSIAVTFTRPGRARFVEWATGLALNVEEHTITQSLIEVDRVEDWRAVESFAEYGHWSLPGLQYRLTTRLDEVPNRLWYGYQVWADDDTKVHRNSPDVWGTCTFHEYTARCPNRATTVRAHNWLVSGALLPMPGQPPLFLPVAGQLYFRKSQLPEAQNGPPIRFRTKCELLVEGARRRAKASPGRHLEVFDGGFALASVVRPLLKPARPELPRIDFVTRLRHDARLHFVPPKERQPHQKGRTPVWGKRLPAPGKGADWPTEWHNGKVFAYGRLREVRYKEMLCQWHVLGHDVVVKAVFALVEGYSKPFMLVSSAIGLTGLQIVELFCARFRQEDGFRDLKQRLGWEECKAWTRNPIERTTQTLFVTMTALRLLQLELQEREQDDWWLHPPWNPRKSRPSVLDVQRLLRQHREGIQQCLAEWLRNEEKGSRHEGYPMAV
jgi:hypothetical protein